MHQVEEVGRVVGVERHDELLVVEAERVGGVDLDRPVAAAGLDVAAHDPHPLLAGQAVPLALLPHRVDDQVLALGPLARGQRLALVGVDRLLGHRQVRVRDLRPAHQPGLVEQHVELVDRVERVGDHPQHQVGVAARADQRVRAQEMVLGEVGAGGGELALVLGALGRIEPAPGRIELQKGELDVVALCSATPQVCRMASRGSRLLPADSTHMPALCDNRTQIWPAGSAMAARIAACASHWSPPIRRRIRGEWGDTSRPSPSSSSRRATTRAFSRPTTRMTASPA